jgi:hypothetical protein
VGQEAANNVDYQETLNAVKGNVAATKALEAAYHTYGWNDPRFMKAMQDIRNKTWGGQMVEPDTPAQSQAKNEASWKTINTKYKDDPIAQYYLQQAFHTYQWDDPAFKTALTNIDSWIGKIDRTDAEAWIANNPLPGSTTTTGTATTDTTGGDTTVARTYDAQGGNFDSYWPSLLRSATTAQERNEIIAAAESAARGNSYNQANRLALVDQWKTLYGSSAAPAGQAASQKSASSGGTQAVPTSGSTQTAQQATGANQSYLAPKPQAAFKQAAPAAQMNPLQTASTALGKQVSTTPAGTGGMGATTGFGVNTGTATGGTLAGLPGTTMGAPQGQQAMQQNRGGYIAPGSQGAAIMAGQSNPLGQQATQMSRAGADTTATPTGQTATTPPGDTQAQKSLEDKTKELADLLATNSTINPKTQSFTFKDGTQIMALDLDQFNSLNQQMSNTFTTAGLAKKGETMSRMVYDNMNNSFLSAMQDSGKPLDEAVRLQQQFNQEMGAISADGTLTKPQYETMQKYYAMFPDKPIGGRPIGPSYKQAIANVNFQYKGGKGIGAALSAAMEDLKNTPTWWKIGVGLMLAATFAGPAAAGGATGAGAGAGTATTAGASTAGTVGALNLTTPQIAALANQMAFTGTGLAGIGASAVTAPVISSTLGGLAIPAALAAGTTATGNTGTSSPGGGGGAPPPAGKGGGGKNPMSQLSKIGKALGGGDLLGMLAGGVVGRQEDLPDFPHDPRAEAAIDLLYKDIQKGPQEIDPAYWAIRRQQIQQDLADQQAPLQKSMIASNIRRGMYQGGSTPYQNDLVSLANAMGKTSNAAYGNLTQQQIQAKQQAQAAWKSAVAELSQLALAWDMPEFAAKVAKISAQNANRTAGGAATTDMISKLFGGNGNSGGGNDGGGNDGGYIDYYPTDDWTDMNDNAIYDPNAGWDYSDADAAADVDFMNDDWTEGL